MTAEPYCRTCFGHGFVERVVNTVEVGCCGNPTRTGECCGNAVPVPGQEIVQDGCPDCHGTGAVTEAWRTWKMKFVLPALNMESSNAG